MRARPVRPIAILALLAFDFSGCETIRHQFTGPARDWQARYG
ncbi:MAG: hypothetical protein QOK24_1701, partial [Verrucomicrobiota bacterium]